MSLILAILSIISLHIIYIYTSKYVWHTVVFISASIVLSLAYAVYLVSDYFTGEGITSGVIYHVLHGQIGEANILGAYVPLITYTSLGVVAYIFFLVGTLYVKKKSSTVYIQPYILYLYIIIVLFTHPLVSNLYGFLNIPTVDTDYISTTVAPLLDISTSTDPLSFAAYMPTSPAERSSSTQKNVLLIYLEGGEYTFSDDRMFENLTPNLNALSKEFTTFTNVHQIDSASYTIGGMVASQCGLPLFSSTSNESHEGMKTSFLGGATCLGDILKNAGYTNTYIGGADISFAGKKTFLASHGYDTILGKEDLMQLHNLGNDDVHNWGVYDDILFDTYYSTFVSNAESGLPFMLTTLTLDTHPPIGYVSQRCREANLTKQPSIMLDAVACTDYLVGELVDKVRQSLYFQDTTIIIISDHLAMNSAATKDLKSGVRTNRVLIIDADSKHNTYDSYGTTLDIGTTILPYIGFEGRIGLGQDLRDDTRTPIRNAVVGLHNNWFYDVIALWNPPTFSNAIRIDTTKQEVQIQNQTYTIPSFINFTPDWESAITFRYALPETTLLGYPAQMEPYKTYLLIEECRLLDPDTQHTETYCIGYGSNNTIVTIEPLTFEETLISREMFEAKAINKKERTN